MKEGRLNYNTPEAAEAQRLAEMRSLSYAERLERFFALMELSNLVRKAKATQSLNHEGADS